MTIRVYEFSKKSGMTSKDILNFLQKAGFKVSNHMTVLSDEMISFLQASRDVRPVANKKGVGHSGLDDAPVIKKRELFLVCMTVAQFCEIAQVAINDVIVYLLKKGVAAPKNYVLSEKLVEDLAAHFSIPISETKQVVQTDAEKSIIDARTGSERRAPIIVIVGHVDHGKTTLLDYIRKTRVADKEKGGITQRLGAYQVLVDNDPVVFLDTPGHEAFSLIRVRGLKVADIAILVVAADDGVMPQTIESIKKIKAAGIPVIVALNKIDKATPAQVEAVKRGLAQYDLLPEEWGGQVVVVPISAKLGTGVPELLSVIHLQSQVMDLFTNRKADCKGFILEARMEKGRGDVATVICHQGLLRVGDYFICGATQGKVTSLVNTQGASIKEVEPSMPVLVAGFDSMPEVAALFSVVSLEEYKSHRTRPSEKIPSLATMHVAHEGLPIIIRADNVSSKEALMNEMAKISKKSFNPLQVIFAGIGMITEKDVELAHDTQAIIYGFNVTIDKQAALEAKKYLITVKLHDVIYKLLEDLEFLAEQGRPVKKIAKKIGEAVVLKVFDIKGIGIVAGAQVKTGKFLKEGGRVLVYRGKYKVGEGLIKSLQRDKKSVKEVLAGFECAFMIEGFSDWIVDDRVECFIDVPAE